MSLVSFLWLRPTVGTQDSGKREMGLLQGGAAWLLGQALSAHTHIHACVHTHTDDWVGDQSSGKGPRQVLSFPGNPKRSHFSLALYLSGELSFPGSGPT